MEMKIYRQIKEDLKKMGRTQSELSRTLGVNYNVLNRYLNGLSPMPDKLFQRIKKLFDDWNI